MFFLLGFVQIFAQVNSQGNAIDVPVRFAAGNFITGNNIEHRQFLETDLQTASFNNEYFVLIQFSKLPSIATIKELKNSGIELDNWYPGNAYFAAIKKSFNFSLAPDFSIVSINPLPSVYKIDAGAAAFKQNSNSEKVFAVNYFSALDKNMVIAELQKAGAEIVVSKFNAPGTIFIKPVNCNTIAALPFVNSVSLQSLTDKPLNYKSIGRHGISSLLSPLAYNLSGKNIVTGIGDNSELATAHVDFTGRVISRVSFPISFHGIHVTGTVAGGGLLDPKNRGMAPRATIVGQYLSDIITNTPIYFTDYNMIATNNSYTAADDSCAGVGVYDILSNYTDNQMRQYDKVLHVVSAGNDGLNTCSPFPNFMGTVKSGYQTAKNVLTVGAITDSVDVIAGFSSRGPVNDGRIKPEIVATGVNIFSTRQNNTYGYNSGTSMSGPIVAGAVTLLNEAYRKANSGQLPIAALIKTVLCNSAEDLGNTGPDYTYGFGSLNARRAADAIENNHYIISNSTASVNSITVPANVRRLKVMLYWADTAAAPNAATTLISDLDLTVTAPGPVTHQPLILDATAANVNNLAAEGADHVNNIEQVVIDNPVAGNYDIHVNAFSLPYGQQQYVVTWQMDMNGVTVEYPYGGETLVPGETEVIRWNAYGDESNTFTLQYFDGTSWNLIDNNVAANATSYEWIVPATVSNDYRVRVSRNSSAYTDESDFNFKVIGQPVVTATVPCEGYVQLSWPTITGATSYDIWQLQLDTMAIIGNTTSLNYLVPGLKSTTTYWFGVSAKNGTLDGRRSVSKSVLPATGVCTLSDFDNNFKAVSIDSPVTKRQFTSSVLTSSEKIRFTIKNLDDVASSGSYDLYYQINNNPLVMETNSIVVNSLATYQYTFTTTANLSVPGIYTIKAWVKRSGDTQILDDTVMITIKNLANPLLTLPVSDGFETAIDKSYTTNTIGLDGDDKVDFKTNSIRGRARSFVNTGFALNGIRAMTLDQFPYNAALTTDSLLMAYNLANYVSGQQLRLDFYYKNHGQENNPNNKVWIRGDDTKPWIFAYNLVANQGALGQWKHAVININDVLDTVLPAQLISSSFQIKFGQQANTSANVPYPYIDQDDGYTFDDVTIKEAANDIGILNIVSPSVTGCGNYGTQAVSVNIKNYSASTFTNVPVYYSNGAAPVMEIIPSLPPGITLHTFALPENLLINTDYSFGFWVHEPSDTYNDNDSILNYTFHTSSVVNTFPYLEGFENNDGGWYAKGSNNSWQWGTPAKTVINKAANGSKAWVTSLTGNYKNNELSYLYSPCFNLSGMTQPVLSFSHIFQLEDATPADYNWIEYSDNGGVTWTRLGLNNVGTNWFNDPTGKKQWRTSMPTWHVASTDIPTTTGNVRFRFVMASDLGFNLEGVGIDDIHIFDKALIYTGTQVTGISQSVSGSSWIHFTAGGKRVASINANGANMGNTTVDVYPYAGTVRTKNGQYYLNRNIVIRPTVQPGTDVSVRFYFTDAEAKSLLAATGCGTCTKPVDPYDLGVTKYSGIALEEDGTLDNNYLGNYSFILPANTAIIPYDNGYYAQFNVNNFSEFWLNDGGIGGIHPLPITLLSFDAIKQINKVLLQWTTENELYADKYIVEKSTDGINYNSIGFVSAINNHSKNNYIQYDLHPFAGLNFYRLKMQDKDGSFSYSPIRTVNFNNADADISIYPNPVTNATILITSTGKLSSAILFDAAGKWIRSFVLKGTITELDLSGIAKGFYQLKILKDNTTHTKKIVIQ
ncbi:MAG TPA: S8 family serine peptidase [Ferruginibacter sp.]|nr:S8 family serine peptidase [Ferruginibacter sp.]